MEFSVLAPYLAAPFWRLQGRPQEVPLHSWLITAPYRPLAIENSRTFSLRANTIDDIVQPFAFDFSRFAAASFESIASINRVEPTPRSLAWAAVKMYYAAFYAAHALLRLKFQSITRIDGDHQTDLMTVFRTYGAAEATRLQLGSYCFSYDVTVEVLTARLRNDSGGFHAVLWKAFLRYVEELVAALSKDSESQPSVLKARGTLALLAEALKLGPGNGTWLSDFRNAVNYRQSYGLWYPYREEEVQRFDYDRAEALVARWRAEPSNASLHVSAVNDVSGFFNLTAFIVAFCRSAVLSLAAANRRPFVRDNVARLLTTLRAA